MIWLFLILLAALVLGLQQTTAQSSLKHLHYTVDNSTRLAEPGAVITMKVQVENRGRLPVFYMRLLTELPAAAVVEAEPQWLEKHVLKRPLSTVVEHPFYLLPRHRRVLHLQFSLPERGWHLYGGGSLFVGDFLGLREKHQAQDPCTEVVVMPQRSENVQLTRALGGFLGDVSVRRFILEDQTLTIGFREYTGREPMKSISWPQSARSNRLMVKEPDYTTDWNVTVLLNTQGGTRAQIEECYRMTRTVCEYLEQKGVPYGFETNADLIGPIGQLTRIPEGLGLQHLNTILYGLGRSHCRCRFSLDQLLSRVGTKAATERSYLLITPPLSPEGERKLSLWKRQHTVCLLVGEE